MPIFSGTFNDEPESEKPAHRVQFIMNALLLEQRREGHPIAGRSRYRVADVLIDVRRIEWEVAIGYLNDYSLEHEGDILFRRRYRHKSLIVTNPKTLKCYQLARVGVDVNDVFCNFYKVEAEVVNEGVKAYYAT